MNIGDTFLCPRTERWHDDGDGDDDDDDDDDDFDDDDIMDHGSWMIMYEV